VRNSGFKAHTPGVSGHTGRAVRERQLEPAHPTHARRRPCVILQGMWIATLLAHLFCNTGYNIILRHAASDRERDPLFLAAVMSTALAAPAAVGIFFVKIDWALFTPQVVLANAACIAASISFHIINAKALKETEAGVFSLLYNFRIGFATLFGIWVFGESIVPIRFVGGALVFVAGLILSGRATATPVGVFFSVLAAVVIAVLNLLEKHLIMSVGYFGYVFPSWLIVMGILWIIVIVGRRPIDKTFFKTKECGALMVMRCVSGYGFTLALSFGALLSVATYISALTCVVTPIAAVIFLKERDSLLKKTIAGVIALSGVTLIFLGHAA